MKITTHTTRVAPDRSTRYRPWPQPRRLLGIWAHPDDETYLSAGLMDRTIRSGGDVTIVVLTDGELGFPADDLRPDLVRRQQRRDELRAAMATIGVHDVRMLGLADGSVERASGDGIVRSLAATMREIGPDVVVTFGPDGITGHPDHVATCRLASRAWAECDEGALWYAAKTVAWLDEWRSLHDRFGMWMTEEPTGVDDADVELVLDLTAGALDRKRAVLAEHASQTAAVAAAIGEDDYRRWIRQETFRRPAAAELGAGVAEPVGAMAS